MGKIRVLDQNMVNMIAAGEVIERPASVVKELMENSIDSGATRISVTVEDGGRKLIAIEDNGSGMDAEDLVRAFETHATSKIKDSNDLLKIATLGFRGEALASIASVALVKAVSRLQGATEAFGLEIDCGQRTPVAPTSADYGSSMQVRDLFYKLPARRKFMRTTNTEMGHVTEQFIRVALANLELAFVLTHNSRELYRLDAGEPLKRRISVLFPSLVSQGGDDFIETESHEKGMEVVALLGKPSISRGTSKFQYSFLNGRFIKDRLITHAIKEAFQGLLEPNRFPVVFLFITMPLEDYDVNVHPTKTEVRFFNGQLVHSQIAGCLREKLLDSDLNLEARLPAAGGGFGRSYSGHSGRAPQDQNIAEAMAGFFKDYKPSVPSYHQGTSSAPQVQEPCATYEVEPAAVAQTVDHLISHQQKYLQIHNSYIVAQTEDGFVIVDQHALHEKILFETMVRRIEQGHLESQRLLLPVTLELNETQTAVLQAQDDLLRQLGIEIQQVAPRSYAVQAFPTLLNKVDCTHFMHDLLDTLESKESQRASEVIGDILDMASCKAAIKAGNPLSNEEIEQLLKDADRADSASRCPHGRPTTIRFSLEELAKQFLRT